MSEFLLEDSEEYRSDTFLNFKSEYVKTEPHFNIYNANQEQYLFIYSHSGEGMLDYLGENYKLSSGTGCFIDCRKLHYIGNVSDEWCITKWYLSGRNADWLYKVFRNGHSVYFSIGNTEKFMKYHNAVIKRSHPVSFLSKLVLSHQLIQLIFYLKRGTRSYQFIPSYIVHLKEMLDNNYHNPSLKKAPKNYLGVNAETIEKEFKIYYELSPCQYINRLRLEEAKKLLKNPEYSLDEICEMTGFSSVTNMIYIFCTMTGRLPHSFRKSNGIND